MFARRRNKPTIISLLDRTENYPITSSGERHNILHTARLHNIVINSNLAVPRNGTSRAPSPTSCSPRSAAAKSLRSVLYFTLCLQFTLVCYAHSSFLISHSSFSLAPDLFKCNRFMPIALICFLLYNIFVNIYSHLAKSRYERTLLL